MTKIVLIDDEPHVGAVCRILLEKRKDVGIVAECRDISTAYPAIIKHKPDVILLDVQLTDGTGFDLLEKFEDPDFAVIIMTSFDEYAIRALKAGAIDYLLKPLIDDEFEVAIEKALKRNALHALQIKGAVNNFTGDSSKITLSTLNNIYLVDYKDLVYCKSDGGYTTFFLKDGKEIVVSKILKHYEAILPSSLFVRCHQSYIINLQHILSLTKGNTIMLTNGIKIPVSVRKLKDIRELLKAYPRS